MTIATPDGAAGPHTLGRWPEDRARLHPQRVAIVDRGVELRYADLDARSAALAQAWLRAGYLPGERIATLVGNSAEWVADWYDENVSRTIRGGGWRDPADRITASRRFYAHPKNRGEGVGFRCARNRR